MNDIAASEEHAAGMTVSVLPAIIQVSQALMQTAMDSDIHPGCNQHGSVGDVRNTSEIPPQSKAVIWGGIAGDCWCAAPLAYEYKS